MTSPIKFCVGERFRTKNQKEYVLVALNHDRLVFLDCASDVIRPYYVTSRKYFIDTFGAATRLGVVFKDDLLETEDWLCHENRCYPKILAGGCTGCVYNKAGTTMRRYYEPGDVVWIPSEKRRGVIDEVRLFCARQEGGPYFDVLDYYDNYDRVIEAPNLTIKFRLIGESKFYRWNKLRCIKRNHFLLNVDQLKTICNELCLFGPHNGNKESCRKCETGKFWKFLNDIRRNYQRV
jgi:hypothetical protein